MSNENDKKVVREDGRPLRPWPPPPPPPSDSEPKPKPKPKPESK